MRCNLYIVYSSRKVDKNIQLGNQGEHLEYFYHHPQIHRTLCRHSLPTPISPGNNWSFILSFSFAFFIRIFLFLFNYPNVFFCLLLMQTPAPSEAEGKPCPSDQTLTKLLERRLPFNLLCRVKDAGVPGVEEGERSICRSCTSSSRVHNSTW